MHDTTIVFDLDGTLIDTAPDLVRAANHALAHAGLPPVSAQIIKPFVGYGARRMILEGVRANQVKLTDPEIDQLLEVYLSFYGENIANESRPFPNVMEEIGKMRAQGAIVAICTNKREDMSNRLIRELGIFDEFKAIAGRDTFPVCKPHPDHLLGTIEKAGGNPKRTIMIGDTQTDVSTARAASIPVVGVTFGYSTVPIQEFKPDIVIENYEALTTKLAALLDAPRSTT